MQARTGSTRLPGKVLRPLADRPLLRHVLDRVGRAASAESGVVATTTSPADRELITIAEDAGVAVYAGSEDDVLSRYIEAAESVGADTIVRVTSDCPVIDWSLIDETQAIFRRARLDHAGLAPGFPRGLDTEVVSLAALRKADALTAGDPARDAEPVPPFRSGSDSDACPWSRRSIVLRGDCASTNPPTTSCYG